MVTFGIGVLLFGCFILGVGIGRSSVRISWNPETNGLLLPQQAFIPNSIYSFSQIGKAFVVWWKSITVPMVERKFTFPTPYEDTEIEGDKLWNDLMPRISSLPSPNSPVLTVCFAFSRRRIHPRPASKTLQSSPKPNHKRRSWRCRIIFFIRNTPITLPSRTKTCYY
jgi:hypothetical protein